MTFGKMGARGGFGSLGLLGGASKPSNNLFFLVGDSRPHADHNGSSGAFIYQNTTGIGWWAQNLSGGRVRFRNAEDYAVGGSTTEDMLNSQLSSAKASAAASGLLLSSTNDQAANNWPASRSIAALSSTISQLLAAGKFLHVIAETPRGSSAFTGVRYTTQQQTDHDAVRAYLLSLAGTNPRLKIWDPYPLIADLGGVPTDYIASMTYDGVHPCVNGAYNIASLLTSYIMATFGADSYVWNASDLWNGSTNPGGNLITNGQMSGTAGTGISGSLSGSLADSWAASTATFTGLTAVFSKVTTGTGNWQQIAISGNSASGTPILAVAQNMNYANFSIGDYLQGRGEFEVDASPAGLGGFAHNLTLLNTGVATAWSRSGANASGPWAQAASSGKWRSPSLVNIIGTENTVQLGIQIYPTPSYTGVNFTVRFRNLDVRKVPSNT